MKVRTGFVDDFIRMDVYTTMHNYYTELPELIKELVMFNVFQGDVEVRSHIISENILYPREALMEIAEKTLRS